MARKQKETAITAASGKLDRWNTTDDIPDTEQDAFHRQQDKILLGDLNGTGGAIEEDDQYGEI